ncbi:deoxycytidylate deaminase-like [Arctopsyche grandis]|uniref:deoxycytidylate deaminase-like n=1 Tax=Arctopsyche grandis TaxID=121162 RepID=UPI00406D8DB0
MTNVENNPSENPPLYNDDYFMESAKQESNKSKDNNTKVGACIVKDGLGYNAMPMYKDDSSDFTWEKNKMWFNKHSFVCHAELNAIVNASTVLKDCSIYTTLFPCNQCAKLIIQYGIKEIIYDEDKYSSKDEFIASRHMFKVIGVIVRRIPPGRSLHPLICTHSSHPPSGYFEVSESQWIEGWAKDRCGR